MATGGSMGWDATSAAGAHSALAGVLAGVVLVLVPLLSARPDSRPRVEVVRLLILALVLLIVAAVIWGGLSGATRIIDLLERQPSPEDLSLVEARIGRNFATGAIAVILMAGGALAMLAGLLEGVADLAPTGRADWFFATAAIVVSSLAVYQVFFFHLSAIDSYGNSVAVSNLAVAAMGMTIVLCLAATFWARRIGGTASRERADRRLMRAVTVSISVTALVSLMSYVFIPVETISGPTPMGAQDTVVLWLLAVADLGFVTYAVSLTGYVALPLPGSKVTQSEQSRHDPPVRGTSRQAAASHKRDAVEVDVAPDDHIKGSPTTPNAKLSSETPSERGRTDR